jgi:2-(1,2-epoxy-1,2-dihydrophenyl)acetyl-CoA isomerase
MIETMIRRIADLYDTLAAERVRSIRATMRAPLLDAVRQAVEREAAEQQRLQQTADWREGVRASLERREPKFAGA